MIDFRFTSKTEKIAELGSYPQWSDSEAVVLDLAKSLLQRFPRPKPFYVLHLDNFFTTHALYSELYRLGIGANGTAKAGSGIPKELAYLRDTMTKEKDYREWFNYVIGNVNCIAFCDMASKSMITTVHDPTVEEYTFFSAAKRPNASFKYGKQISAPSAPSSSTPSAPSSSTPSTLSPSAPSAPSMQAENDTSNRQMWLLRTLYALADYNQNIGGADNHVRLNSLYSTAQHYHRRNWLLLLYLLLDAAVTNSYILYKLGISGKQLSHVNFQEQIARELLRGPGAILRQRIPRHPRAPSDPHTKPARKEGFEGHSWVKGGTYRQCRVCNPRKQEGRPRGALQELSVNVPDQASRSRIGLHRTVYSCSKCGIPICYKSRCWDLHLANPVR